VANSGSFIRPSASIILGRSFLQALASKYVDIPHETSNEKVVLGSSNGAIEIEAVGMNKVRSKLSRLERLREVSLDKENVARGDEAGQIRQRCPSAYGCAMARRMSNVGIASRY
jgi:tubulin-specific chaperone E